MKFELNYQVSVDDDVVESKNLKDNLEKYRSELEEPGMVNGSILVSLDGEQHGGDFEEPLIRLAGQWVQKLPWVVGGDTETVAFRNSEHCFAFIPAGESVEFSLYEGDETEIADYVVEPTNVLLDAFATETIRLAEELVEMVRSVDPELLENDEDCKDLVTSLEEGKKAWHDYELHRR